MCHVKKLLLCGVCVAMGINILMVSGGRAEAKRQININVPSRVLVLSDGNKEIGRYPIGVGKASTQTPIGEFVICSKEKNPVWISPHTGESIPSGAGNPLGYRWMQIQGTYGIHGTNRPESVGGFVSDGCIRLKEADIERLYDAVPLKTPVHIEYKQFIIEKAANGYTTMALYPDAYYRGKVTLEQMEKQLAVQGLNKFVAKKTLQSLMISDYGEKMLIGRVLNVNVFNNELPLKIVEHDGIRYLLAEDMAAACHVDIKWSEKAKTLSTAFGKAPGYERNGAVYMDSDYAYALFRMYQRTKGETVFFDSAPLS